MASQRERENFVCITKLAEQAEEEAERQEEMVDAMKKVAKLEVELTVEERNLLSVGYKNVRCEEGDTEDPVVDPAARLEDPGIPPIGGGGVV